jgi:hypothetical protein
LRAQLLQLVAEDLQRSSPGVTPTSSR